MIKNIKKYKGEIKPLAILLLSVFIFSIIAAYVIHYSGLVSAFDPCPDCGREPREPRELTTTTTTRTTTTTTTTITHFCGDGILNNGEVCELPGTTNNAYCPQTTSDCQENKTGTRDNKGNCNANCQCAQDPFNYICVKDSCNAQCDSNDDCPNKCVGDRRYFNGVCNGGGCYCNYQTEDCTGDGWYDISNFACDGACRRCNNQEYRNYRCEPGGCTYDVTDTRQVCENAPSGKHCVDGSFTTTGYCGSSSSYCGNGCNVKIDRYECNINNQCSKLDYTDTSFCPADTSCSGGVCSSEVSCGSGASTCVDECNRAGQLLRCNSLGSCSNFWQFIDPIPCNPYTCASGSCTSVCSEDCGAECDSSSDCSNKCIGTIRYYGGTCPSSTCSCNFRTEDCSKLSSCKTTSEKRWVACSDDSCKLCEQVKKECYEGVCEEDGCVANIVSSSLEFTGRRQAKTCPTGTYCQSDTGECIPKVCQGEIIFEEGYIFEGDGQACPKVKFNVSASIELFTTFCDKKRVYFKLGSCDGTTLTYCILKNGECRSKHAILRELGTPKVVACVDLNGDGDFNDNGEQDSLNVNVNCNNCLINRCSISAGCTKCRECGLTCGSYTNQYNENRCLNPDQQCLYSCIVGSCGARHCAATTSQSSGLFTQQLIQSTQAAATSYVTGNPPCAR